MLRLPTTIPLLFIVAFAFACERGSGTAPARASGPDERKPFTILATGDIQGRYGPCGCDPVEGGMPRRVALMQKYRAEGPVLVLDAGDSLAEDLHGDAAGAKYILSALAATGVAAAAVGETDLYWGLEWLQTEAAEAGVPYLSANLRDANGEAPFPGRKLVEVAGNRVGIFAVLTTAKRLPEGLTIEDPSKTAEAEVRALRDEGAEFVIALVHGPMREVNQVATVEGIDLAIAAHRGGKTNAYPRGDAWVAFTGREGRSLLELRLDLRDEGKLMDESHLDGLDERAAELERKIAAGNRQLERMYASPQRTEVEELVAGLQRSLERVHEEKAILSKSAGKKMRSRFVTLTAEVGEDPAFLEVLQTFEEFAQ